MLPEKVKVAGIEYQVKQVPIVEVDSNRNYQGLCNHMKAEIEILESLADERKEQVFIHELTHAMLNESGYGEHDEDFVTRFSIILHQVLKDNDLSFIKDKEYWESVKHEVQMMRDTQIIEVKV